jgi:parallel beta-helix repeat protein
MSRERRLLCVIFMVTVLISLSSLSLADAEACECASCEECVGVLNDPSCQEVRLIQDIVGEEGTCINNPAGFENKVFDCQGHKILGDMEMGVGDGIFLEGKEGNTIRNCEISKFRIGIWLRNSHNNIIEDNIIHDNNNDGVLIGRRSESNIARNNEIYDNEKRGIHLLNGVWKNTIVNNVIHGNNFYGIILRNDGTYEERNVRFNNISYNTIYNNNRAGVFVGQVGTHNEFSYLNIHDKIFMIM